MELKGDIIYQGDFIELASINGSYYMEVRLIYGNETNCIAKASEDEVRAKLSDLSELTNNFGEQPYNKEADQALCAFEEYLMYGDVQGRTMADIFDYDAESEGLTSDEAQLRLENVIQKRPTCYGGHPDQDNRNSRCLICEHEHDCIRASQKLKSAKSAEQPTKKANPKKVNNTANKKEDTFMKNMENLFKEFYPSEVPSGEVAMTMYGQLAVRRKDGSYVRYNNETGQIENQMSMVISSEKLDKMYLLMPTPIVSLAAGDIIKEKETYYQIIELVQGKIKAANLSTGTESNIKIETNIFTGQKMYRKVFSFFNMAQQNGNQMAAGMMNPMMFMMMDSAGDSADDAMKMMAMMSMMPQMMGGQAGANPMMNPMMMYMMIGDSKGGDNDWMKMMAMSSMMQQFSGVGNGMFGFPMQQQFVPQQGMNNPYPNQGETEGCNCGECSNHERKEAEESSSEE